MVWVQRDAITGAVNGVLANQSPGYTSDELPDNDPAVLAYLANARPSAVLSQDLMAQFTVADYGQIKGAIASNDAFGLLWSSLQAQSSQMFVTNTRFIAGWSALVAVLGQSRMNTIAAALSITVT